MSKLTILVGGMATGKSTLFANIARSMKDVCLVMDPGEAPAYAEFPEIPASKAYLLSRRRYPSNIFRIVDTGDRSRELAEVYGWREEDNTLKKERAFLNGNLFLEDAGAYIDSSLKRGLRQEIKSMKQHGLNLFVNYHALSEISTELIVMNPHTLILKKTADDILIWKIAKIKKLEKFRQVMKTYYKVKFRGKSPEDIIEAYSDRDMWKIFQELRLEAKVDLPSSFSSRLNPKQLKAVARELCKYANGKLRITAQDKEDAQYYHEAVELRK